MRNRLNRLLRLDRVVIEGCPDEAYLSAGPTSSARPFDQAKAEIVIAKLRRSHALARTA